ncbi:DUF4180 domain-containing protein [Nocardiopsis ansamitocini]|uniref:DUF4180 domain-containing protein n=1 Tax=Nocardiopsis ansamitocini TaxID=1670832 RepID=A0A9W6P738_9ACTN|nr:DUF4180 domain-containing protein [Nocardiopsis ansamitocini]GLU48282.1 hypothetical protein Nans01_26330 [Nocardiopsis ansamitocini]
MSDDTLQYFGDEPVLVCSSEGPPLRDERAATDVLGDGFGRGATWVAVPVARLTDAFFQLRTRVAGEIVQKFANYRMGLAIVGDISRYVDSSTALRDFVGESNRGGQLCFVPDIDALRTRLARD